MIEHKTMNWKVFGLKFDKREEWAFEQMSYLLFCAEHNNRIGLFRYKNQAGIETEPLVKDGKALGFQSKYYTSSIANNKGDIIDSLKKAKSKNKKLDELYFYINQEFSESSAKNKKKPQYQIEIEATAERLGVKLLWRIPSHIELQLSLPENKYIYDIFFNLNPSEENLIDSIFEHNDNILKDIQTEISYSEQCIKIDRKELIETVERNCSEHKNIIISGEGGCGKTAIFKDFYAKNEKNFPICVFKSSELNVGNVNDIFRFANNFTLAQFIKAYKDEPVKIFVIDSAEKLAEISDFDVVNNLIRELKKNAWNIIFTTRYAYLNDLAFYIKEVFQFPFEVCDVSLLKEEELISIATNYGFQLPDNFKFQERLRNLFYLKEYIRQYQDINKQGSYKDFREVLWRKHIMGNIVKDNLHIERERCIIEIVRKRCETSRFYINAEHLPQHVLYMLKQDEILGYDDSYNGYFFTHDIYEEWALNKIVSRDFLNYLNITEFFETLGSSLPIRRAFRLWLSERLAEPSEKMDDFIKESFSNEKLVGFWKEELMVSILMSDYSSVFFKRFEKDIVSEDYKLLKKILFLLRIACVDISASHGYETITPKGRGWEDAISLIYKFRDDFLCNNINHVLPILSDWCACNKAGKTTKDAGLLALSIIQETETKDRFFIYDDLEEKILKVVFDAAGEIKKELKDVFDKIVANHRVKHIDPYERLCLKILEKPYLAVELIKVLPISIIQLCDLFWKDNRKNNDDGYGRIGQEHMYGLTDTFKLGYFPASANQTPIKWLLQVAFKETLDFIISFTNRSVEAYRHSKYGREDVEEIILYIGETEVQQYISNAIWGMHRGIIGPVVPYLLQSMHMALEKVLLEVAESLETTFVKNILINILANAKSASLTSIVCSVVLAYPDKYSDIALLLFKTIQLFQYDSNRRLNEFQAKSIYSIGYGLNKINDVLYTDERLKTCEDSFRNTCLEQIFLNYQYFGVRGFSEEQNIDFVNCIYKIIDEYKADNTICKNFGILLARMDRRNLAAKVSDYKDGGILIEFTPKELTADIQKESKEVEDIQNGMSKYTSLRIWADFLHNRSDMEKSPNQIKYDNNPLLALSDVKQLIEDLRLGHSLNERWYYSVPAYVCSILLVKFVEKLSDEDKVFCKEIVIETILNLFDDNYTYQIGDGVEAAFHALPVLMSEYPNEIENYILFMIGALFDDTPLGEYKRICDYVIESIHDSDMWKENFKAAQTVLFGYIKLKPIYNSIVFELRKEQGGWVHLSKQTILTNLSEKSSDLDIMDLKICKGDIEELDIFDLGIVLQLVPSNTTIDEHLDMFEIAIPKFSSVLFKDKYHDYYKNNTNNVANIYRLRLTVFRRISRFLLNRKPSEVDKYLEPILKSLLATEETALFVDELVNAEDYQCKVEQFWNIWKKMYPFIKNMCFNQRGYHLKDVIISYMLAWHWWREGIESWHSLTTDNLNFYSTVSVDLGHIPPVLYSVARVLCTIGSTFVKEGIEWLYTIVSNNHSLVLGDLESNTLYYIESFLRKFVFENRDKIKRDFRLKSKLIEILNFIIERGSMRGYLLRESII